MYHRYMQIIEFIRAATLSTICLISSPLLAAELLIVESDDCPYCKKFHAEIGPAYPNTEEGSTAPLRSLQLGHPMPAEYKNITPATVTPTFILVHEQREIDRLVGYPGDEHFWFLLGKMLAKLDS